LKSPHRIACRRVHPLRGTAIPLRRGKRRRIGLDAGLPVQFPHRPGLGHPLRAQIVLRMRGRRPGRPPASGSITVATLHIRGMLPTTRIGGAGQGMVLHLHERRPGRDQVAEVADPAVRVPVGDGGAEEDLKARQQFAEQRRLIMPRIAAPGRDQPAEISCRQRRMS
jgi:hypothetical protein